jgi:hypothetical protein
MTAALDNLLEAIGAAPSLPGARCKGSILWDETEDPEIIEYTTNKCLACPELAKCRAWLDSLPRRKRPEGVCAGVIIREPTRRNRGRPRKEIA